MTIDDLKNLKVELQNDIGVDNYIMLNGQAISFMEADEIAQRLFDISCEIFKCVDPTMMC